ncbi:MAG: hypothetical protein JWR16_2037 [Nevskia sp.]|nr:hypothetical protein [Nevskia sp.]
MITAIAIVALIAALALAVDIGQLYYAQRDLEKQATLAALAGAQVSSGCRGSNAGVPGSLKQVQDVVTMSITNNPSVIPGAGDVTSAGINGHPYTELGWVNDTSGQVLKDESGNIIRDKDGNSLQSPADGKRHFFPLDSTDPSLSPWINSVRVNLSRPQPALLIPFISGGGGAAPMLYASATAKQQAIGSFYLGVALLGLDTSKSPLLGPLLQGLFCGGASTGSCAGQIKLLAASSSGLVNANISLGDLLGAATSVNASITDLSSLLTTQLTLPQWLGIVGTVLGSTVDGTTGQVSGGVAGLVTGLAGMASPGANKVSLGSILNTAGLDLNPAVSSIVGAVPFVNGLDLLAALGEAATADPSGKITPIALPVVLSVPGVATASAFLQIGAPPKFAIGPAGSTSASTAEITLMVRIHADQLLTAVTGLINSTVNTVLGLVGLLSLGSIQSHVTLLQPPLNIGVDVHVNPATASLDTLQCPTATTATPVVGISGNTAVTTLSVGTFSGDGSTATPLAPTGSLQLADISVDATHVFLLGNLGSTDLKLVLGLTSVSVGNTPFTLDDVTQFVTPPSGNPPSYVAYGAPSPPTVPAGTDNPQTRGSSLDIGLTLKLDHPTTGSGLTGVIGGLVNAVLNAVNPLLQNLLNLVNGLVDSLIDPLLNLLGIQVGAATVMVDSVTVAPPVVVTHELPSLAGP